MRAHVPLAVLLSCLAGCPESPAPPMGEGSPAAGGVPPPPGQDARQGEGGEAGTKRVEPKGWGDAGKDGVRLAGTMTYAGTRTGTLRIDFLKASKTGGMPSLEHTLTPPALGPWEVVAPKDAGTIVILAYIDLDENGPSPGEPKAITVDPVQVGGTPVTGLDLALLDDWDTRMDEHDKQKAQPQGGPPPSP